MVTQISGSLPFFPSLLIRAPFYLRRLMTHDREFEVSRTSAHQPVTRSVVAEERIGLFPGMPTIRGPEVLLGRLYHTGGHRIELKTNQRYLKLSTLEM